MLFFNLLIMSILITISSNSWFGMWMGLEMNMLSIIPLMNNIKNLFSSESSIKYFITQALSSSIILFSMILMIKMNNLIPPQLNYSMNLIINSVLLVKMGSAPFHFWFPEIMEGLNWPMCLIMLTMQKINPMILISYNFYNIGFLSLIIILNMLISGILGLNQTSIRKILTYSSINHIGWMLSSLMILETIWISYFFIYSLILMNITIVLKMFNIFHTKQLILFMSKTPKVNFFFMLNFMSLGGIPPFIGFLPKWLTIQQLINCEFYLISFSMIILTLITLFYYIRLMISSLNLNSNEINFLTFNFNSKFTISYNNLINLISLIFCTMIFNLT
uniref:NADH-ubiquinone oxidoreductase chain 2 n=1 Tax=Tychobythinus sp. 1 EF-2015 TaxID=1756873 RepID=A0A0S2M988_9COLE|nr:NADH deshydrogenase subunit 2 [Tychobythinus sp. 1 EF-2015]